MSRVAWEAHQRIDALLAMLADDAGPNGAGSVDLEHVETLRKAPVGRATEVAQSHADGRGPPEFANNGGN